MERFHKKIIIACTLLLCACFMTGCEDVPADRQQDTKQEIATVEDLVSEQYVSLREAKEQLKVLEGKNIDGLSFAETIQMPDVESISEIRLTPYHWNKEQDILGAISSLWRDYDSVDWDSVKEVKSDRPDRPEYFGKYRLDKKTNFVYGYDTDGYFTGDSIYETGLDISSCVAEYDFEWGDTASDTDIYQMKDGKLSVPDAVRYAETQLNQHLSPVEKNKFTYKIQHLYVLKHPDEDFYDYEMVVAKVYQGISLLTCDNFLLPEGKYYDRVHCGERITAVMFHKELFDCIINGTESLDIKTVSEKDRIISPFWAVQQIDREIAHVGGMSFGQCGLFYLLEQDNESKAKKEQGVYGRVNNRTSTCLKPMWVFTSPGETDSTGGWTRDIHGSTVLVDALDGTLWYYQGTILY